MASNSEVMEVDWSSWSLLSCINNCVDLALGNGAGVEKACCWSVRGKRIEHGAAGIFRRPLEGTVADCTFLLPLCRGNNWVDTERGRLFGEILIGWSGAKSGPSWSNDLLCLAEGASKSLACIVFISCALSLLGDQTPIE